MRCSPRTWPSIRRSRLWSAFASACIVPAYPAGVLLSCYPARPVASRQEEKEKRRQERLAREQAEAAAAARRKRLQYALGGLIALAVVAGVVVLAVVGLGGSDSSASGPKSANEVGANTAALPKQATSDMAGAAKAASCKLD